MFSRNNKSCLDKSQKSFSYYDDYYYDFVPTEDDLEYYNPDDYPDYDLGVLDREQIGNIKKNYKSAADRDVDDIIRRKRRKGTIAGSILGSALGVAAGYGLSKLGNKSTKDAIIDDGLGMTALGAGLGTCLGRYLGKRSGKKEGERLRGEYYKERDSKIDRLLEMKPEDRRELRDMARREHDLREQERLAKAQLATLAGSNQLLGCQNEFLKGGFMIKPRKRKRSYWWDKD